MKRIDKILSQRLYLFRHEVESIRAGLKTLRTIAKIKKTHPGKNVVIIARLQHFGDLIAAEPILPLVSGVENYHPIWIVRENFGEVMQLKSHTSHVVSIDCLCALKWFIRIAQTEKVFDLHFSGENCHICGRPYYHKKNAVNTDNYYLQNNLLHAFSKAGNLPFIDIRPKLNTKILKEKLPQSLPNKYWVIHREVEHPERQWTNAKWDALIQKVLGLYPTITIVEVGLEKRSNLMLDRYLNQVGKHSLSASAALIAHCQLFIGVDSGPAHLAHASERPAIILLGKFAGFTHYTPYSGLKTTGETTTIIDKAPQPCRNIEVEEVLALIHRKLAPENG